MSSHAIHYMVLLYWLEPETIHAKVYASWMCRICIGFSYNNVHWMLQITGNADTSVPTMEVVICI